tara:strand:+ start:53 stop:364 length:312 start_codon:yes stop_codon:yes gene_type:complete
MTADDKMLIFKNADDDTAMVPLSRLKEINGGSGSVVLTFDAEADVDVITLGVGDGSAGNDEFEACKELVRFFNSNPNSDGALVVADDVAGVYCSSTITAVGIA